MDEEPAVFEQLILYEIKLWSSISLKTFNNYSRPTLITTLEHHECGAVFPVANF